MKNLKKLRLEAGLSQQALADKFHLSQQSIQKYECGISDPNLDTLKSFANYFNVSVDYLIDFKDEDNTALSPLELEVLQGIRNIDADVRPYLIELIKQMK